MSFALEDPELGPPSLFVETLHDGTFLKQARFFEHCNTHYSDMGILSIIVLVLCISESYYQISSQSLLPENNLLNH